MKMFEKGSVVSYPKDYRNTKCTGDMSGEDFKKMIESNFPNLIAPLVESDGWGQSLYLTCQEVLKNPLEKGKRPKRVLDNKCYICVKAPGVTEEGLLIGIHDFKNKTYSIEPIGVQNIFDEDFDLVAAKELLKLIQKEKKGLIKKVELDAKVELNKDEKQQIGALPILKETFLSIHLKADFIMSYFTEEKRFYNNKVKEERERAWNFMNDESEAAKAGWNYTGDKKNVIKENNNKQLEWANKAYSSYKLDIWLAEFEEKILINYLKSFS